MFLAILIVCVQLTCAFNEQAIQCCKCSSMFPIGVNIDPQVVPSPFKIEVDPKVTIYSPKGEDINGEFNLPVLQIKRGSGKF